MLVRACVLTGFAILYMLVTVPQLLPWNTKGTLVGILSWCHLIGAVSPWIGSFLYHLFMNVNYDEVLYRTLLKVDMIGIWLCQSFGVWYICRCKSLSERAERTDVWPRAHNLQDFILQMTLLAFQVDLTNCSIDRHSCFKWREECDFK